MTCKQVLLNYLYDNPGWHKKVHLYAVAEDWEAESVGRELRNMAEDSETHKPEIFVDYYDGKYKSGLAMYCAEKPPEPPKVTYREVIINGSRIMQRVEA